MRSEIQRTGLVAHQSLLAVLDDLIGQAVQRNLIRIVVVGVLLQRKGRCGRLVVGQLESAVRQNGVGAGAEGIGAGVVERLVDRIEGGEVHQAQEIADRNVQLDFQRLVIHSGHAQIGDGLLACDDLRRIDDLADIRQHVGILGSGGWGRQKEARCNHTAGFGKGSYFA